MADIAEPLVIPEIKPDTRPQTPSRPAEDDPFYFPGPKVDPTPKG